MNPRKILPYVLAVTALARLALATLLPMTGDEAYYVFWGKHLDYGYYDQPPMVGWILWILLKVSDSKVWVRLPAIAVPLFVAWVLDQLGRDRKTGRPSDVGAWAAILFSLTPVACLVPAITTDIPLIFWVAVSVWFFDRAERGSRGYRDYAFTGLALGAAFLSKYFAVLLVPAWFGYWIFNRRENRTLKGIAIVLVTSAWGPVLHLAWNATHCWANIVFNLFVRNTQERFLFWHVQTYVLQTLYLLTPFLIVAFLWALAKKAGRWTELRKVQAFWVWALPSGIFLLLTLQFGIGMHFVLSFYPYFFIAVGRVLSARALRWSGVGMFLWTLAHVPFGVWASQLPLETFRHKGFYRGLHQTLRFELIARDVLKHAGERNVQILADAYSQAALLGFHAHRDVWVFGVGSDFGRVTDFVADWRALDGKDAVLFWQYDQRPDWLKPYFRDMKATEYTYGELHYWVVEGSGFQFSAYERDIRRPAFMKYYRPEGRVIPWGSCPIAPN